MGEDLLLLEGKFFVVENLLNVQQNSVCLIEKLTQALKNFPTRAACNAYEI